MVDTNTEIVMEEVSRDDIEQIVSEEPVEAVKMKKPRAKAKPKEPTITKEDIVEAVKEATKKPIPDKIDKNKEMVTCEKCGLSITRHNLKYTHARYCKALKLEKQQEEEASSSTPPPPTKAPPPGLLVREKRTTNVDDVNEFIKNNPEVITNFLRNERADKANKQQNNAKSLLAGAF